MATSYSKYSPKGDMIWLILRPWILLPRVLYILLTLIFLLVRILFQGNSNSKSVQKNLSKYLFDVITDLGPCFIKLGQALSTRPDLVRQDWLAELTNLQDNLPPFEHKIALKIISNGKGILAADESNGTMSNRLEAVGVSASPATRNAYRANLFSTNGYEKYISGVILFDETIRQEMPDGRNIPDALTSLGVYPGIKLDTGAKDLANHEGEKITEGLDGLRERLKEYYKLGAKFTKWRGVYTITKNYPSKISIHANAHALARYSALVQECNMVPIVEPEVLMDGDHSSKDCLSLIHI